MVLSDDEVAALNFMSFPTATRIQLGTIIKALQQGNTGDGDVPLTKLEDGTEAFIIVCNAQGVPVYVAVSGDIAIAANGAVTIGDNKVLKKHLKTKTISVTVAGGASTGTVTDADAINGEILGVYPSAAAGSAIKDVALTAGSGKIDVELVSAQGAGTPATIQVVVLRAA